MRRHLRWALAAAACLAALPRTAPAQDPDSSRSIWDVAPDDPQYQFLKLGQSRDYLRAERWRITQQIEQAIPPLYEPRLPFHGYTLPPGTWRLGLQSTFGRNPSDFGRDDFYAMFFDQVKVDFTQVNLIVEHGFEVGGMRDLALQLDVPFKFQRTSGTGHPFRIDPMLMTMEGSGRGLGDVAVTLKKKWLDQGTSPANFATMLGVIFPTADDDQEFNASQTVFMNGMPMPVSAGIPGNPAIDIFGRQPGDLLFPAPGQPGNGTWGVRLGFGLSRQFDRSALHTGAVVDLLARTDGITRGNELRYGLSYVFPPTSGDRFTLDLSLLGIWKGTEKFPGTIVHPERDPATGGPVMDSTGAIVMFSTPRPDFEHGHAVFASPALIFITAPNARLSVSPSIRLREPDQGPTPRWMLNVGYTFTF